MSWGKDKNTLEVFLHSVWKRVNKQGKSFRKGWKRYVSCVGSFVGIPVPGTGAWTGILAASILEMDFKESIGACFCGVLLAGVIMAVSSMGILSVIL